MTCVCPSGSGPPGLPLESGSVTRTSLSWGQMQPLCTRRWLGTSRELCRLALCPVAYLLCSVLVATLTHR